MLWTSTKRYEAAPYEREVEIETAILEVQRSLFGTSRIYLNIKKKIGSKGKKRNIPDGYLLDLASKKKPVLFVVEVELAKHDPLKHIAVQILEFSLAFESEPQRVKSVIREALESLPKQRQACERYATENGFDNLDYLLERMIYDGGFWALVIIDELVDELETVLVSRFKFGVEVIELMRFVADDGGYIYQFDPFLADIGGTDTGDATRVDLAEVDTIVVPARVDGFEETFIKENRWYSIRIHGSMIPKIKYIAGYQAAPVSAITHVAPVASIDQWRDTAKYVVNFSEPARELGPLGLVKNGSVKAPQGPRYTSIRRLHAASNLDEAF